MGTVVKFDLERRQVGLQATTASRHHQCMKASPAGNIQPTTAVQSPTRLSQQCACAPACRRFRVAYEQPDLDDDTKLRWHEFADTPAWYTGRCVWPVNVLQLTGAHIPRSAHTDPHT